MPNLLAPDSLGSSKAIKEFPLSGPRPVPLLNACTGFTVVAGER